jgi:Mg-chelatase subunit ChlD
MNTSQRVMVVLASLFSVLVHVLLIIAVMDLRIGSASASKLFDTDESHPDIEATPVFRATKDLIEDDTPAGADPLGFKDLASKAPTLTTSAGKLLNSVDTAKISPLDPATPPTPNAAIAEELKTAPAPAAFAPPPPPRPLDTAKLLAMADPAVVLPKFVGPTDAVAAPAPTDAKIDPANRIDVNQIKRSLPGATTDGSPSGVVGGVAGGVPGGTVGGLPGGIVGGTVGAPLASAPRTAPGKLIDLPAGFLKPAAPEEKAEPIHLDDDFDYAMRVFTGPLRQAGLFGLGGDTKKEANWFEVTIQPRRSLHRLKALRKDVVYVVDTSESISPEWIAQMKLGLAGALDSLDTGDRFNIVFFKDTLSVFTDRGLAEATPDSFAAAKKFIDAAKPGGYTDVNQALARLIVRQTPPDRVYQIIFVSDGQPTRGAIDAAEIINVVTRENDLVAGIYGVAVGSQVNRRLMELLSYRNKGSVVYPKTPGDAAGAIRELASRLRYPVVKDAVIDAAGVDPQAIYPRTARDIYQGEVVHLYGRYTDADPKLSLRVTGVSGPTRADFTFTLPFPAAAAGTPQIAQDWAMWKMHHLNSEMVRRGETDAAKREVEQLKKQYDLKTGY